MKRGNKLIQVKSAKDIASMMKACELSQQALMYAGEVLTAGMSTYELDRHIHDFIVKHGGKPSFLGLYDFPASACISVNEELIHGIPNKHKIIREGDIVSVDVGAYVEGFHGDNAYTFAVGEVDDETKRLLAVTKESLYKGIEQARKGNRIGDIGNAVQTCVEEAGYYVVKRYIGHGVGRDMHEDPEVPNYGKPGRGVRLVPGMTIAIEPMVNSSTEQVKVMGDKWTVVEGNGKMCAHFEHTVLITEGDPVIMTLTSH